MIDSSAAGLLILRFRIPSSDPDGSKSSIRDMDGSCVEPFPGHFSPFLQPPPLQVPSENKRVWRAVERTFNQRNLHSTPQSLAKNPRTPLGGRTSAWSLATRAHALSLCQKHTPLEYLKHSNVSFSTWGTVLERICPARTYFVDSWGMNHSKEIRGTKRSWGDGRKYNTEIRHASR